MTNKMSKFKWQSRYATLASTLVCFENLSMTANLIIVNLPHF